MKKKFKFALTLNDGSDLREVRLQALLGVFWQCLQNNRFNQNSFGICMQSLERILVLKNGLF